MKSGMVPIIAFNYGAKREDRVIQTLKLAVMYAEIIMVLFMIAVHTKYRHKCKTLKFKINTEYSNRC